MMRGLLLTACLALGCSGGDQATQAPVRGDGYRGSLAPEQEGVVVAEVNGDPIYAADVERHARARGLTPREATGELIEIQLLAQEARRRGLDADPHVLEEAKKEMVRRFTEAEFVARFDGPEDVPLADVERLWRKPDVRYYYDHEDIVYTFWVRVPLAKDAAKKDVDAAFRLARKIYEAASADVPEDVVAFNRLAKEIADAEGASIEISPAGGKAFARNDPVEKTFKDAAFSVREAPGVARPARTPWGVDVLLVTHIEPERHWTFEQAVPELRARIFEESRQAHFLEWTESLMKPYAIVRHEERLDQAAVSSPVGLP